MNERNAVEVVSEIVLAIEPSFRLAETEVRPSSLEVLFHGETAALEPRVMQVLVALSRNTGGAVSRQSLVDTCWAGRVVTEGALNRSIAQLRKALRDPGIRIDTVPTVGYRLQIDPTTAAAAPLSSAIPDAAASRVPPATRTISYLVVGLLAAGAGLLWWRHATRPIIWTATAYRPLTYTPDQETFPALSPDGRQLVYSATRNGYGARDLFLRSVNDGIPIQLTNNPADDYGATWSPDGDRVAFVRATDEKPCQLLVIPIPVGLERVVTDCEGIHDTRTSWLNARTLLYADKPLRSNVTLIRAVDIESGRITDLTAPPQYALGDADPQAAPDGRHIVFRRMLTVGADDLAVLDLTTRTEQPLTTDGWKSSGYVWSADSRYVFFASNRGGDFGLWSIDRDARGPPHRVSLGMGAVSFTRLSADRQNRVAVELAQGQAKLASLSLSGHLDVLTAGAGSEADPAVAPDGAIAHVSNRNGFYELWLLAPGRDPFRLTSIQGSYIAGPCWSAAGTRVAFVAVKGRRAEIFTVARDGSQLRQLTNDSLAKQDVVFVGATSRLLYLARLAGRWKLMSVADTAAVRPGPATGTQGTPASQQPGADAWLTLRGGPAGSVFGQREGEEWIRRIEAGALVGSQADESFYRAIRVSNTDLWAVGTGGVYVRRRVRTQPSSIWFFPWHESGRKIADVPLAYGPIAIDPTGAVILSQSSTGNIDLALVELHPEG